MSADRAEPQYRMTAAIQRLFCVTLLLTGCAPGRDAVRSERCFAGKVKIPCSAPAEVFWTVKQAQGSGNKSRVLYPYKTMSCAGAKRDHKPYCMEFYFKW